MKISEIEGEIARGLELRIQRDPDPKDNSLIREEASTYKHTYILHYIHTLYYVILYIIRYYIMLYYIILYYIISYYFVFSLALPGRFYVSLQSALHNFLCRLTLLLYTYSLLYQVGAEDTDGAGRVRRRGDARPSEITMTIITITIIIIIILLL